MFKTFWGIIRKAAFIMLIPPAIVLSTLLRILIEKEMNREIT